MREFQQKRRFRRAIYSKLTLAILLVILFVVTKASWNVYTKEKESRDKAEIAQAQLSELKAREVALSAEVERLKTEDGVEQEIRENFRMAKQGENLVIFVNEATPKEPEVETGFVKGLWHSFLNIFK